MKMQILSRNSHYRLFRVYNNKRLGVMGKEMGEPKGHSTPYDMFKEYFERRGVHQTLFHCLGASWALVSGWRAIACASIVTYMCIYIFVIIILFTLFSILVNSFYFILTHKFYLFFIFFFWFSPTSQLRRVNELSMISAWCWAACWD